MLPSNRLFFREPAAVSEAAVKAVCGGGQRGTATTTRGNERPSTPRKAGEAPVGGSGPLGIRLPLKLRWTFDTKLTSLPKASSASVITLTGKLRNQN